MINPLKALLFLAGGTAVVGVGAYASGALDPFFNPPPAEVAGQPTAAAPAKPGQPAATKESRLEGSEGTADPATPKSGQAAPSEQKPQDPQVAAVDPKAPIPSETTGQPAAPAKGSIVPTFDLVRVEADGSMVIAGRAAPKARVELLTGGSVIGNGTADEGGDFVIVLDKPLAPGDYQITIRATDPAAAVASAQTAIVSIPKENGGEVLAMIEEPGKPSEIITVPQPDAGAKAAGENSVAADTGSERPATEASGQEKPAAAADEADAPKPADATGAQPQGQPAALPPAASANVAVEAVEIDGAKVFVAGRAPVESTVRVYADDTLLGESKASKAGRFLVEAMKELPVGDYIVRADVLGPDGAQVVARAAVPFEREAGENIAAVAPSLDGAIETAPAGEAASASAGAEQAAAPSSSPRAEAPPSAGAQPSAGSEQAPPSEAGSQAVAEAGRSEASEAPAAATGQPSTTAQGKQPAAVSGQAAETTGTKPSEHAAAAPSEATAPALQPVNSAVIIRRGDSLWRISKRVYGRGVRYSTIYLANQDQIRDPDMIWPGQVFSVPDRTEQGEAADMTRMGAQATSKSQ